ncbi:peptidase domain-containing ABC transporter [Roseovarius sp. 2305UL8-3]|uniref:peptidase domain-containing ABC transporter n=1 Tax=Roseovarius conchicola TaxID=3121636 RepID=UPI00352868F7
MTNSSAPAQDKATEAVSGPAGFAALDCFVTLAREFGLRLNVDRLVHEYGLTSTGLRTSKLLQIIRKSGCTARQISSDFDRLQSLSGALPALVPLVDGGCIILLGVESGDSPGEEARAVVFDPHANTGDIEALPQREFEARWSGKLILVKRRHKITDTERPFNLMWFVPELWRERRAFRDVLIAAAMLVLVSLSTPIFFQIVVDKVLVHQSVSTLTVLTIGVAIAILFEATFTFVRQYILLFATQKVDVRITMRAFTHLLKLPIDFFEQQSAGVLTKHMQQLDVIRQFLTGRLLVSAIDVLSLIVFLPALIFYSGKLTLLVLGFGGLTAFFIFCMLGPFRNRLQRLYAAEGARQSLLVETIHGMQTVKALSLEPQRRNTWETTAVNAVETSVDVGKMSAALQFVIQILQKLMLIAIIAIGAFDVFAGILTVGALIAFQMLAGRVAEPLIQLVGLLHEYQETALSVRMLGNIMNHPQEPQAAGGAQVVIEGEIEFDDVTFRYPRSPQPSLDGLSFKIEAGTMVGLVGRSGSGKTTVTKLLQGLHQPQAGSIRIDGIDSRELDIAHLRRNTGVVLQESFLFRGTIRDNICISAPTATDEQIFNAARMAGADEFVQRLPKGYDTELDEGAPNLSGGQKQRLSIARALLSDPRILILDEATSALDPESESIIQENLEMIRQGRTVIMVSHRLASMVKCDEILVLDQGKTAGLGPHDALMESCPIYWNLWMRQNSYMTAAE